MRLSTRLLISVGLLGGMLACSKGGSSASNSPDQVPDVAAPASSSPDASFDGASATSPSSRPSEGPRNVLLLSIDSLRADMPWAGYPRAIGPRLTAFEKQSVSYTHAYAISSYTSMSLGGLLAGRYPHELQRDGFFFGK